MATTLQPIGALAGATIERPNIWYDYELQVWVRRNIVQSCAHKETASYCCNQKKYAGCFIWEARTIAGLNASEESIAEQWGKQW
jgi:hypothetical protein